jgi:hypothetical protein
MFDNSQLEGPMAQPALGVLAAPSRPEHLLPSTSFILQVSCNIEPTVTELAAPRCHLAKHHDSEPRNR